MICDDEKLFGANGQDGSEDDVKKERGGQVEVNPFLSSSPQADE